MTELSNLMSKAKDFLITKTSKEVSIAVGPLFRRQDTREYDAALALYKCCVAKFSNFLIPKFLATYLHTSDGVLRFRMIYLLSGTLRELRKQNFKLSPWIVSFIASNVVMLAEGGWDELSDCIIEFADIYPFRAFHVFLDLPLGYKKFIKEGDMQRILVQAEKVLLSPKEGRVAHWSLALETVFKVGVLDSQTDVESIVLRSVNVVVKKGMEEFLGKVLEDLKKFLSRDGNVCKYSKDQRVFVGRLAFNLAACYQTVEDSKNVASEVLRVVRKPKKYGHDQEPGFDVDWCDYLKNLSSLEVLRIFARTDLGESSRELGIRRLEALLSRNSSSFFVESHHVAVMRQLQPLLISCLEEDSLRACSKS